jgi:hypothetical protein
LVLLLEGGREEAGESCLLLGYQAELPRERGNHQAQALGQRDAARELEHLPEDGLALKLILFRSPGQLVHLEAGVVRFDPLGGQHHDVDLQVDAVGQDHAADDRPFADYRALWLEAVA